jgi:signal transduction histidine kinase
LSKSRRTLKRSLDKLTESDRLKTEFFSNVSHELRTPLTMILAPVDRLLNRGQGGLSADDAKMLEMVRLNGYRLLDLINRLLDFSKLEAGQMKLVVGRVDLAELVGRLTKAATPLAEQRGIELVVDCDASLPPFGADQEKVDTIVSNLLSNAIKFTPKGGSIRVETHMADDRAWVAITDTGIGIDESQRERVFERFVQVDGSSSREFSGTGLGLSLVKGLVELHGGGIHLQSQLGQGSKFFFDLPLRPAPDSSAPQPTAERNRIGKTFADLDTYAEAPRSEAAQAPPDPFARTILVVDDTTEMRVLLGEMLREDYRVLYGRDGREGLEVARREHPDLIISDVMMPHVDGQEFCRRIKEDAGTAHIPFVMLTAKADLSMKIGGLNCGADDYLTKPFEESELKARVRSLLKLRGMHQDLDRRNRELRTAYNELRALQKQLVQAEKMSSLGQLIAGLAHEINNSINAVYNGIRPLAATVQRLDHLVATPAEASPAPQAPQNRAEIEAAFKKIFSLARVIETGASRTARIIGDLKMFSHPGNEDFQVFDLHESLDMCVNLLSSALRDRVEVVRDYGQIGRVFGPAGQLNQVFMNLLNNAQQAINGAGTITVSTRQEGEWIRVAVRDDGCGIPAEVREKIFDPFFTTKEPGVGTGLGLSLSYGLISKLGGTIECHSEPGKGAEFVVRFPCVAEAPAETDDESDEAQLESTPT